VVDGLKLETEGDQTLTLQSAADRSPERRKTRHRRNGRKRRPQDVLGGAGASPARRAFLDVVNVVNGAAKNPKKAFRNLSE
jgi:hypothetical protein